MIKHQTKDFIDNLQNPQKFKNSDISLSWKFIFLLIFASNFVAALLGVFGVYILENSGFEGQHQVGLAISNLPIWLFTLLAVVQAPITEEITFRLWLKTNRIGLLLACFGLAFYLQDTLYSVGWLRPYTLYTRLDYILSSLINSSILTIILAVLFNKIPNFYQSLQTFIQNKFNFLFYFSCIVFGLIHIQNYIGLNQLLFLTPLLVLPQTVVGLVLGYIRVKSSIFEAISGHALFNFISALPIIILSFLPVSTFKMIIDSQTDSIKADQLLNQLNGIDAVILSASSIVFILCYSIGFSSLIYLIWSYFKAKEATKTT